MATPNYGYEKRQRELAKKKKKEEKLRSKTQRRPDDPQGDDQPADGQPNGGDRNKHDHAESGPYRPVRCSASRDPGELGKAAGIVVGVG